MCFPLELCEDGGVKKTGVHFIGGTSGVDVTVNLGDILYGPIAPKATYELLMEHELVTIRGNQDRQIYEASEYDIASNPTMQFIVSELGDKPLQWMKNLPFSFQLNEEVFVEFT